MRTKIGNDFGPCDEISAIREQVVDVVLVEIVMTDASMLI